MKIIKPNTVIRATKLINFEGDRAEYHHNGVIYLCVRRKGRWYTTFDYLYA